MGAAIGVIVAYFAIQMAVGFIAALVVAVISALTHADSDAGAQAAIDTALSSPASLALITIIAIAVAIPLTVWWAYRQWQPVWHQSQPPGLGFVLPDRRWIFGIAFIGALVAAYAIGVATDWLAHGRQTSQDVLEYLSATSASGTVGVVHVTLIVLMALIVPFVEELLFRGALLSALVQRAGTVWAVVISSLLFGLIHLPGLSFQWYAVPGLILIGVGLAVLRLWSGSLWPAVLAHATNNGFAIVIWWMTVRMP